MNRLNWILIAVLFFNTALFAQVNSYEEEENTSPDGKYTYYTVSNDPLKMRRYVLANGLTVLLSVNKKEPRIQTLIATRAGSKNDPADNTGLAHYLEHMLFKGTDLYGSKDWPRELEQLNKIDALYELYNKTTDEAKRKFIYHQIDSVSGVASRYAIANEYDKMMQAIGAQGTNAFTSLEQTVYVNDIPENNLERWIAIEAERFRNPVLRLFHTELEAVYEEKNIGLDNDGRKVYEALLANLFRKHSYGTQTTIGTVEHLKNPSLVKIRNFYNTWYAPNNMAIILAGDFDPDKTIKIIDEKFSYMTARPLPKFEFQPEQPRNEPTVVNLYGPDAENLMIGFRMPQAGSREALLLMMCDMILSNTKAGLIDLNLMKKQAVLAANSAVWINRDYSIAMLTGKPKKGQSLDDLAKLILSQIELIKNGQFDESLIPSILANLKVQQIQVNKNNSGRAYTMLEAFTLGMSWKQQCAMMDEMAKITKADIMKFASEWYTNDYVLVKKNVGEDKNIVKVPKPQITPVEVNRDDASPFVTEMVNRKTPGIRPRFIDYSKDLSVTTVTGKLPLYYVKNEDDALFQLYYVFDMGKWNDLKLPIAVSLLEYLGTSKMNSEQLSKEFYRLACDFDVYAGDDQVYVSLRGLNDNFEAALKLFEDLLANVVADQKALDELVERIVKSRADAKLNKGLIFRRALQQYAIYGKNNPFTYNLSEAQLRALKAEELIMYIKSLNTYKHTVYYFGPRSTDELNKTLSSFHKTPGKLKDYPAAVVFTRNETKENTVFFTDYKMVQAEVMWINKSMPAFDSTRNTIISLFNEYFGGGMSSLVFQTIRESKALAYSTYSAYQSPGRKEYPYYIMAYVGTQADKIHEAIPAMNELLNNMPKADKNFEAAKAAIKNSIETERINDEGIIMNYAASRKLGVHHDLRRDVYENIDKMSYKDLQEFYNKNYVGNPYYYCIMASKEKVNVKELSRYGKVMEVTLEAIFGY